MVLGKIQVCFCKTKGTLDLCAPEVLIQYSHLPAPVLPVWAVNHKWCKGSYNILFLNADCPQLWRAVTNQYQREEAFKGSAPLYMSLPGCVNQGCFICSIRSHAMTAIDKKVQISSHYTKIIKDCCGLCSVLAHVHTKTNKWTSRCPCSKDPPYLKIYLFQMKIIKARSEILKFFKVLEYLFQAVLNTRFSSLIK